MLMIAGDNCYSGGGLVPGAITQSRVISFPTGPAAVLRNISVIALVVICPAMAYNLGPHFN